MRWRQVLLALLCTGLTVQSSPCSWVEVLSSWSQGYKAVAKLQMEATVDHWDVDVEFSESVINFEAWKGHVNKISDTYYSVSNTCYNNMVYSCQCFELPYIVRHEPLWEGNTTFKFNGELVPACEPPSCDDSLSGAANNTSTSQPAESLTTSELTENLNVVGNMLNDLSSLRLKRYQRQANSFTKDENELLDTLAEYTTYLKNECSTKSGSCQSKTLAAYGSKLNSVFQKVKNSGRISSGFVDAFKEKYEQLKEATKTAVDNQAENSCKANGKPCIFPFKDDAGKEHNTCADYKGRYVWCATRVNSKGKYVSWEKCPDDGRCPLPKKTTTTTTTTTTTPPPTKQPQQGVACMAGSKPCVFPFKDTDGTEYNECADYKGRYFWCATAINSKGTFTNWGKCTECKDPNTPPSTPEDCSCTDYINKKGYGDCQKGHPDFSNAEICYVKLPSTCSDLRESKTDPGKMASAEACKKVDGDDSCCQEVDIVSTGVALEHQGARLGSYKKQAEENDGKPVYLQEGAGGNYLFYRETFGWLISRQGPQSTSKGGIMSDSEAECPTDGGMQWKIYDRVTYDNIDSTFKLTCKGSDTTVSNHQTKPPGSCLANGKPCIFPFKDDDGTSYNGCPKYEGRYYWCATSLKTNGVYEVWEHCPEDDSCPLLNNNHSSTPDALPKPTTKLNESPETTPSVKWEPGTTSFHISDGNNNYKCEIRFEFNVNKKTEFKAILSTCSETKKQEDVMQYVGKYNFSLISKEGTTLECFIAVAISRGEVCQTVLEDSLHCDSKSDLMECSAAEETDCPIGYTFIPGGFAVMPPMPSKLLPNSEQDVFTPCDCKKACDERGTQCLAFFFNTCENKKMPSCLLLNVETTDGINEEYKHYVFCKRGTANQDRSLDNVVDQDQAKRKCNPDELHIIALPVGKGDSTVIKCSTGELSFIDVGTPGVDIREYMKMLQYSSSKIDAKVNPVSNIFLTHEDDDHISLFDDLLTIFKKNPNQQWPVNVFIGGNMKSYTYQKQSIFRNWIDYSAKNKYNINIYVAQEEGSTTAREGKCGFKRGTQVKRCQFVQVVGHAPGTLIRSPYNICPKTFIIDTLAANYNSNPSNKHSLVMRITSKNFNTPTMLFTGDFEGKNEFTELIRSYAMNVPMGDPPLNYLKSDVLWVPHHGSKEENGYEEFFKAVNPLGAVVSADPWKRNGHPNCYAILNLKKHIRIPNNANQEAVICRTHAETMDHDIRYTTIYTTEPSSDTHPDLKKFEEKIPLAPLHLDKGPIFQTVRYNMNKDNRFLYCLVIKLKTKSQLTIDSELYK